MDIMDLMDLFWLYLQVLRLRLELSVLAALHDLSERLSEGARPAM